MPVAFAFPLHDEVPIGTPLAFAPGGSGTAANAAPYIISLEIPLGMCAYPASKWQPCAIEGIRWVGLAGSCTIKPHVPAGSGAGDGDGGGDGGGGDGDGGLLTSSQVAAAAAVVGVVGVVAAVVAGNAVERTTSPSPSPYPFCCAHGPRSMVASVK